MCVHQHVWVGGAVRDLQKQRHAKCAENLASVGVRAFVRPCVTGGLSVELLLTALTCEKVLLKPWRACARPTMIVWVVVAIDRGKKARTFSSSLPSFVPLRLSNTERQHVKWSRPNRDLDCCWDCCCIRARGTQSDQSARWSWQIIGSAARRV